MPQPSALAESMLPSSNSRSHLLHRARPPTHSRESSAFTPFSTIGEPNTYTTLFASTARKHLSGSIASHNPTSTMNNFDSALSTNLNISDPRSSRLLSVSAVWMVYVYAFISLVFFFSAAYSVLGRVSWSAYLMSVTTMSIERPVNHSYLDDLTDLQRMAKLSSLHPPPQRFEPSYIMADPDTTGISACIWASDSDLGWVTSWMTDWDGPISLLVVSRSPQISQLHDIISGFLRTSGIDTAKVSIHLLQLHPATPDLPNAFLNLARLFAPTASVLLVPGTHRPLTRSPSSLIPPNVDTPTLILSANDTYSAAKERDDVLAPVFLPHADDVWCTERFFSPASPDTALARSADWSACIWQLHLNSLGGLGIVRTSSWHFARATVLQANNASTIDGVIHRRLSSRYRIETCVLAIKRQEVLAAAGAGPDAQGIRWLQTVCKAFMTGSLDSGSSKVMVKST